jgi:hypothetical protein
LLLLLAFEAIFPLAPYKKFRCKAVVSLVRKQEDDLLEMKLLFHRLSLLSSMIAPPVRRRHWAIVRRSPPSHSKNVFDVIDLFTTYYSTLYVPYSTVWNSAYDVHYVPH